MNRLSVCGVLGLEILHQEKEVQSYLSTSRKVIGGGGGGETQSVAEVGIELGDASLPFLCREQAADDVSEGCDSEDGLLTANGSRLW